MSQGTITARCPGCKNLTPIRWEYVKSSQPDAAEATAGSKVYAPMGMTTGVYCLNQCYACGHTWNERR